MSWWGKSWNPILGCTKCSPACDHCYAERLHTQRHKAKLAGAPMPLCYAEPFDKVRFLPERTWDPLRWRKTQRVFVGNMTDIFHPDVPDGWLDEIFEIMAHSPQHTFILCTKRPKRMEQYINDVINSGMTWREGLTGRPLPNVWLGTTIWDQPSADDRIPILLSTPAAKHYVSYEPALGPVDLGPGLDSSWRRCRTCGAEALALMDSPECGCADPNYAEPGEPVADWVSLPALDWVICGGETGPGARPMHPDWPRALRDQCQAAGVPFFFKQWGEWGPLEGSHAGAPTPVCYYDESIVGTIPGWQSGISSGGQAHMARVGTRRAGRVLDGRTWEEVPA